MARRHPFTDDAVSEVAPVFGAYDNPLLGWPS
jgi:hypothetical protein